VDNYLILSVRHNCFVNAIIRGGVKPITTWAYKNICRPGYLPDIKGEKVQSFPESEQEMLSTSSVESLQQDSSPRKASLVMEVC